MNICMQYSMCMSTLYITSCVLTAWHLYSGEGSGGSACGLDSLSLDIPLSRWVGVGIRKGGGTGAKTYDVFL